MEQQYAPQPNSHMALAIFSTICCCLPLGIVAIVKASKVSQLYALQQYTAAHMAAEDAKKWCIIAIVLGVVVNITYYIFYGAYMATLFSELY